MTFGLISLKCSDQNWVSQAVPLRMYQRVTFEKHSLQTICQGVENFIQSLSSFLISVMVPLLLRL